MRPAQYASSSANVPLKPAQNTATSSPASRAASATACRFSSDPIRTVLQRAAAVRIAEVPSVVERISVRARALRELARRGADVEPLDDHALALPADDRLVAELRTERVRLLDLAAAEHPLVAGCERL